jgi:serine/threonine protein kinase
MFEFLTGRTLFALMMLGHDQDEQDNTDDDHLVQLNDVIRPLPDWIMQAWPRASKWYGPGRQRLQPYSDDEPHIHDSIEKLFVENRSPEIDEEESVIVLALMQRIFEYDPQFRPTGSDLLQHPWFSSLT